MPTRGSSCAICANWALCCISSESGWLASTQPPRPSNRRSSNWTFQQGTHHAPEKRTVCILIIIIIIVITVVIVIIIVIPFLGFLVWLLGKRERTIQHNNNNSSSSSNIIIINKAGRKP